MGDGVVRSPPPPEAVAPETAAADAAGAAEARGGGVEDDETVLQFLDSVDSYLALTDSLSSILRQGWLELASARHSMGSSRISSAVLDLKVKSAPTTLQIQSVGGSSLESEPHFSLSKWSSCGEGKSSSRDIEDEWLQKNSNGPQIRRRSSSCLPEGDKETNSTTNGSPITIDNNVQRERMKSLSVFGTLVSPKLRSAQGSFETALEAIVEIANMRSKMLSAFSRLHIEKEGLD